MEKHLYLEDLSVGDGFRSGTITVSTEDIKRFAREFDPQAFHLDEEAAKSTMFHGLVASGWHTAALTMRLLTSGGMPFPNGVIGAGGELDWPRPVRPGDSLRVESEIIEIISSRSRKDRGIVKMRTKTLNQNGEVVQTIDGKTCRVREAHKPRRRRRRLISLTHFHFAAGRPRPGRRPQTAHAYIRFAAPRTVSSRALLQPPGRDA